VRIVSIIGHKKTGKTRLIEALIPILQQRGHRVGTVKHAPHTPVQGDPTADSARHRKAGAERTLLAAEDGAALFFEPGDDIEGAIEEVFFGFDIVLVEGYKDGPFPKIEVYRRADDSALPLATTRTVSCLVTNENNPPVEGIPIFSPDDIEGIAQLIERIRSG